MGRINFSEMGRKFLDGRVHRTTDSWMVHLDANPSSSEIDVIRVQDWISADSGVRCVLRTLRGIPLSRFRMKTTPRSPEKYRPTPTLPSHHFSAKITG